MKFGIFDHVDRSNLALHKQLDDRLEYVKALEDAGFYSYHVAEHHATPLNLVPVPGVYLGAVANATSTMRLGPLCYLLPLYSPLRLIEEISILDHLSHGRLDVGVGRGVSPFELNFHKVDPKSSVEIFLEALDAVKYGLTHEMLDHDGKHYQYKEVPMELRPLQDPHPPIWYPSSNPEVAPIIGESGYNFVTLGAMEPAKKAIEGYKEGYAKRNGPSGPALDFPGGTAIGISRHVVVGETMEDAMRMARPAYQRWHQSLVKLWVDNKVEGPAFARGTVADVQTAIDAGTDIVGDPAHVTAEIERQVAELGVNYMVCQFYFGDMAHEDAMRSVELFKTEVMPKVSKL
jgi:alkanesulfonate monooxygenase SsuD/methylene tetrahydromethanopterin reductase-like flavin-dependent oxidoreductase (luciferase family)